MPAGAMTCDILNLEWSSSGRDREVASAICHTLRRRGHRVVEESIFNYRYFLLKHRPRLLYLADPGGARINYEALLFATRLGIPCVSVDAEGNYSEGMVEQTFWGVIPDRRLREQAKLQWSARAREMVLAIAPELEDRLKVTGAVGFDRYRFHPFASKDDWRKKYGFGHEHVVGYATWGFDSVYGTEDRVERMAKVYGPEAIAQFRHDRDAVRDLLEALIRGRSETLFLLKEHPGVVDPAQTEIAGLDRFDNVLRIKNEEPIGDCINVCDVWMAYESTTSIEAWLLDTPTLAINPSGTEFLSFNVGEGTPSLRTVEAVDGALREYETKGRIAEFDAKAEGRRNVLADTLQWDDGKNHQRAAHYIEQLLREAPSRPARFPLRLRLAAHRQNLLFRSGRLVPFSRYAPARARFTSAQLAEVTRRVAAAIDSFDDSHPLSPEDLAELERLNG